MAILVDMKDPRVQGVTVTHVSVDPDMRAATVHVSVMGDDKQQRLCLYGLESATGFLQRKVGDRVQTRYTPKLRFELDMGIKKSLEIARILREVLPPSAGANVDKSSADVDEDEYEYEDDALDAESETDEVEDATDDRGESQLSKQDPAT